MDKNKNKKKMVRRNNFNFKKYFLILSILFIAVFFLFVILNFILPKNKINKIIQKEIIQKEIVEKEIQKDNQFEENEEEQKEEIPQELNWEEKLAEKEIILEDQEVQNILEEEVEEVKVEVKRKKTIIIATELRGSHLGYFYAYEDGVLVKSGKISSGRDHYETPLGKFKPLRKERYYSSNLYRSSNGRNNMNYMVKLTNDGIALHEGSPNQVSHGCVHIAPKDAPWIFKWSDKSTDVYITEAKINKDKSLSENIKIMNNHNSIVKNKRAEKREEVKYWDNGNYKSIEKYVGGYLNGWQLYYWENGFIKEEKFYKKGRWNGRRIEYWDNGKKMRDFLWRNDELQTGKSWNKDGKLLFDFDIRNTEPVKINRGE